MGRWYVWFEQSWHVMMLAWISSACFNPKVCVYIILDIMWHWSYLRIYKYIGYVNKTWEMRIYLYIKKKKEQRHIINWNKDLLWMLIVCENAGKEMGPEMKILWQLMAIKYWNPNGLNMDHRWAKYMGKIDTIENIAVADPKNMYLDICIDPR